MPKNEKKYPNVYWMSILLIAVLLFAYYACTWRNFAKFQAAIDTCGEPFCDFASFYYPMGEAIFRTGLPVQGFVYSPFTAILFAVFPQFGFNTSLLIWGILQAVSIILYLNLFRRLIPTAQLYQPLFVFLALSSFPFLHAITWGQVGIITTVSVLGALFFYERCQRVIAVVLLAFGLSFKFFPIIFLIPFIIRRDIRFLLIAAVASGTFLFIVPAILLGVEDTIHFYTTLIHSYRHFDWVTTNYNSQYFPHVLLRLLAAMGFDAHAYLSLFCWIGYSIMAFNIGLLYLVQRARLLHANLWSFHILFLSIPFVLLTSWPVDLVYITFAQGFLTWQLLEEKKSARASQNAKIVLLLSSIIISSIFFFNLIGDNFGYGFYGFIFWSNMFLLAVTYADLLPIAFRQIHLISTGNLISRVMERSITHAHNNYLHCKNKLMKTFDRLLARVQSQVSSWLGEEQTNRFMREARQENEGLLPRIPYIGESSLALTFFLPTTRYLAMYRAIQKQGRIVEETGRLIYQSTLGMGIDPSQNNCRRISDVQSPI